MTYKLFLLILSQLVSNRCARVWVEKEEISVCRHDPSNHWIVSTSLLKNVKETHFQKFFGNCDRYFVQSSGTYIENDRAKRTIDFVQTTPTLTYKGFSRFMSEFVLRAQDWRETLALDAALK
ncbi:MAG: hypothetical protein S4CHLAM102_06850 [Chlamydiia bacterium]|nr:hypothetical protein [Chlamydiia bacterium]